MSKRVLLEASLKDRVVVTDLAFTAGPADFGGQGRRDSPLCAGYTGTAERLKAEYHFGPRQASASFYNECRCDPCQPANTRRHRSCQRERRANGRRVHVDWYAEGVGMVARNPRRETAAAGVGVEKYEKGGEK